MTEEMLEIINSTERRICVQAKAGTGKTSTIREYIKSHNKERILYLVFSAEMKKEAEKSYKGLDNCEIRTIHSLAYRWWVNTNRNTRYKGLDNLEIMKKLRDTSQLEIREILKKYVLEYEDLQKISFYYNAFLCSNCVKAEHIEILEDEDEKYLNLVDELYNYHKNNNVTIPHNFYLKEFSLSNPILNGYDTICLDECLDGNMYVKTDKGAVKIRSIHNRMLKGEKFKALSFNHKNECFELKSITASKETLNRDIFEIKTEGLNKLRCTDNHKVLTQFGYVEVKDLKIGVHQLILDNNFNQKTKYKLNDDQLSVVMGSFLGDGYLEKRSKFNTYRLKFTQGEKQLNYLKTKADIFNISDIRVGKSGYTGEFNIYNCISNTFILDEDIWTIIKNKFDEKALAIWFMDDGSYVKSHKNSYIHCNNLNDEESNIMSSILKNKFNINNSIKKNKDYNYLYIPANETRKLISLISPYVHEELKYKLGDTINFGGYVWDNKFKSFGANYINSIEKVKVGSVYDISVEDNHNFVTVSTNTNPNTSGIIVHNCQDINMASLNIITSSNLDKKIIAVGDTAQSIFGFMHCKNALSTLVKDYNFKEYKLTMSFRISDKVANYCSRLLNWFYEEDMNFRGNNKTELINIDVETCEEQVTILTRTRIGALLEVLSILEVRPDAKFYYHGGLDKYDLNKVEEMIKYNGIIYIEGQKFHINTLRAMIKEGLDDAGIQGIISRYDFINKNKNCLQLIKSSVVTDKEKHLANFCLNTLHGCKGSTYNIVKLGNDIGGVSSLKDKYIDAKDIGISYDIIEVENSLNLLYVGMSRATKYLDIGSVFTKEDKIPTGSELKNIK